MSTHLVHHKFIFRIEYHILLELNLMDITCLKKIILPITFAVSIITPTIATAKAKVSKIPWQSCYEDFGDSFECATIYVPLDHQNSKHRFYLDKNKKPNVEKVGIAVLRIPAGDQKNKKGSLFFNPGGPGGSGIDFMLTAGPSLFTKEVRERFDFVGFDPRGIGRSRPLICFDTIEEVQELLSGPSYPLTEDDIERRVLQEEKISELCATREREIIDHMSTADVARDLNLLRRAVGDRRLHFAGYSYGSYLGVTYAKLFPRKVGSLIVDGVLDPVAWATGHWYESDNIPFSTRLGSDIGAMDTLNEFFRLCDEGGPSECALAGNSAERFDNIARSIREQPRLIEFSNGDTVYLSYDILIGQLLNTLYNADSWPEAAWLLADIEANLSPRQLGERYSALGFALGFSEEEVSVPQPKVDFAGVACSDSDNPESIYDWLIAAEVSEYDNGYFGPIWTWQSSICLSWQGSQDSRYAGPFYTWTRKPVLVINTLYDPATPYHGALVVDQLMLRSRLLTIDGWGHTSLFLSSCATDVAAKYLLSGKLPKRGAVCRQDEVPFGGSYSLEGYGEDRSESRLSGSTRSAQPLGLQAESEEELSIEDSSAEQSKENRRQALRVIRPSF